jgi:hypothetical protein
MMVVLQETTAPMEGPAGGLPHSSEVPEAADVEALNINASAEVAAH